MLRSMVRDCLADEKGPIPSPAGLFSILSYIKTHGLLSECLPVPSDGKLIEAWSSSVDAWVDRLLSLVSSNMAAVRLFSLYCSLKVSLLQKFSKCGFFEHMFEVFQLDYDWKKENLGLLHALYYLLELILAN